LQLWRQGIAADFELIEQLRTIPQRPMALSGAHQAEIYGVREASGLVRLRKAERTEFNAGSKEVELDRAGEVMVDGVGVRWHIKSGKPTGPPGQKAGQEVFDADRVGSRIVLRHWQPGDRFQPIGMDATVKLQDIFTNECVPRPKRHQLLVAATSHGDIFWVEGLRISERFKLTKTTIRRLHWRWQRPVIGR